MKPKNNAVEEAETLLNSENHVNDDNTEKPQIVKITEAQSPKAIIEPTKSVEQPKSVVKRQTTLNTLTADSLAPRRLSQLFVPLKQDELASEEVKVDETSTLLDNKKNETVASMHVDNYIKTPLIKVESCTKFDKKSISDIESNTSSKSGHSSVSNSDDEDNKVPSMNDTICSNRSSYFKHYYLYHNKGGEDSKSRTSTRASSLNSLASLIKEKDSAMPAKMDTKKSKDDIGLMVLVIVLFLVLVVGISLIYYFYYKHLIQLSLFKRLKYNEEDRLLELFDSNGKLDIIARMGINLPKYSKPDDCTEFLKFMYSKETKSTTEKPVAGTFNETIFGDVSQTSVNEFQFDNETVCLDWLDRARVQIHKAPNYDSVTCYNVFWMSHLVGKDLQDCFYMASNKTGVWWGIGELTGGGYPLENVANLPPTPFFTSNGKNYPWGKVLRRVFVSSNGGMITLPDHLPARIEILEKMFCISANSSDFVNARRPLTLNYTICSSPNISSTVGYLHVLTQDSKVNKIVDDDYESNLDEITNRIENPTWIPCMENLSIVTQDTVLDYVKSITFKNNDVMGNILLPLSWQEKIGQFTFDKTRFPDPKLFITILREMGFNLALTISSIVATDTSEFEKGVIEGYWVKQKESSLPILLTAEGVSVAALIDFTNPIASNWFTSQIENLQTQYGINHFFLSAPDSNSMSVYYEFYSKITNPDVYFNNYIKAVTTIVPPIGTDAAIAPPPFPTFVRVESMSFDWKSLKTLVSQILTLSMLGYPLIDAGPIGGTHSKVPEANLYIRWVQVTAFLPVFTMNVVPNMYNNDTKKIVEKFINLRKNVVIPRLYATINQTLINKNPLLSPLGLVYPDDLIAAAISDEWIIGNDLLVAPVLSEAMTIRDIYIPDGLWESQLDGKLKRGPGWVRNYEVPLYDVAYFVKRYSITLSD